MLVAKFCYAFDCFILQPSDASELRKLCRRFRKSASSDYTNGLQDERYIDETGDEATENDNETQSMTQSELSQDQLLVDVNILLFAF